MSQAYPVHVLSLAVVYVLTVTGFHSPANSADFSLDEIDGTNGFRVKGSSPGDQLWRGRGVGDVNNDGIPDLGVTANRADPGGRSNAGQTYIIFGHSPPFPAEIDPAVLDGSNGFAINGIDVNDGINSVRVAPAGDVNGDGIADIIVGARGAEPSSAERVGEAYVVFGRNDPFPAQIELSSLDGTDGFRLFGIDAFDDFGRDVAGVGDFNGDGVDDLLIGGNLADPPGRFNGGEAYIVFGRTTAFPASFGMASLDGSIGFTIRGEVDNDLFGCSVDGAGDVNGDGLGDAIVGACQGNSVRADRVGKAYILLGNVGPFGATLEIASMVTDGSAVRLLGTHLGGVLGTFVAGAGDVNGDDLDDVIAGEPNIAQGAPSASYVVFGSSGNYPQTINLAALDGINGFTIPGQDLNVGRVGGGGDVNGDGIDDVLVGAPGVPDAGVAYLILGNAAGFSASFDLSSVDGSNGVRLLGRSPGDSAGNKVSVVGDIDADGLDEFLIGSSGADNTTGEASIVAWRALVCQTQPDADGDGVADVCDACPHDNDGDGFGSPPAATCGGGPLDDCDDNLPQVFPGNPEECDNLDNDCNGLVDEGNPQGGGACDTGADGVCSLGVELCDAGVVTCFGVAGAGCEICGPGRDNGLDDDCDGSIDENDPSDDFDGDGVPDCLDNCCDAANPSQSDIDSDGLGNACDCDPAPPDVGDSVRVNLTPQTEISWAPVDGIDEYHLYRGYRTLGNPFQYNHQCLASNVSAFSAEEPFDPRPFTFFYYLVTSKCPVGGSEGPLGSGRPSVLVCPDPTMDLDGDGTLDALDNCPGLLNPSQSDVDGDSHGDPCDNCLMDFNPDQADLDGDGTGDVCDPDVDGDGILDDGDGDGTPGSNPCTGGNTTDCDDNCPRQVNPAQIDSDTNGGPDGVGQVCDNCPDHFNPNQADSDADGIGDACDPPAVAAWGSGGRVPNGGFGDRIRRNPSPKPSTEAACSGKLPAYGISKARSTVSE